MRSDRRPTLRDGVVGLALKYRVGTLKAVVQSEEALTVGIKTLNGNVYGIERKVIATLFVFGLVIDRRSDYLNLARIEVSLEICGIVVSVPQAPLEKARELERLFVAALVGDSDLLDFAVKVLRNEELDRCLNAVLLAGDDRITKTVTALVLVKLGLYGRPAGIPHGIAVLEVEVSSAHINGNVVVAVTSNPAQTRVLVEAVSSRRIGDQREETLSSEVVYPRIGSARRRDNVLL